MRTIRAKMTLLVVVLTTVMTLMVGVIVGALLTSSIRVTQHEHAVSQASTLARLYSQQAADVAKGEKPSALNDDALKSLTGAHVWYEGVSFYPRGQRVLSAPDDLKIDISMITSVTQVDWKENGTRYSGGAAPVELSGQPIGAIIVAQPKAGIALLGPLVASISLALVFAWIAGSLCAAWFARRITRPLVQLAHAAREVSGGTGRGRSAGVLLLDYSNDEEVRDLQGAVQRMLDELAIGEQRDDHFFTAVTHELRTPLTVMIGQLGMIRDKIAPPEERLPEIERQVLKMERLIGDLVDIARLRQGRFELIREHLKLNEWGPYVASGWQSLLPAGHELSMDWGPVDQPELYVDPERLEQIFYNLVRNAGRHARTLVRVTIKADAEGIEAIIEDDGADITLPTSSGGEEIFESFVSDGLPGGIGMGLTISRELARAMNGEIVWVAPKERGPNALDGAQFSLALPASPDY
jgi:signal transduction histidine kinase